MDENDVDTRVSKPKINKHHKNKYQANQPHHQNISSFQGSILLNPQTLNDLTYDSNGENTNPNLQMTRNNNLGQNHQRVQHIASNRDGGWSVVQSDYDHDQFHSLDFASLQLPSTSSPNFQSDVMKSCGQSSKLKSKSYHGLNKQVEDIRSFFTGDAEDSDQPRSLPPDLNRTYLLEDVDQTEKVKNKIMSVWNNVKYGIYTMCTLIQIHCTLNY